MVVTIVNSNFIYHHGFMNTQESRKKTRMAPGPASDMHPADIKCALEKAGWTLRQLSKKHGFSPNVVGRAFRRRYPKAQEIIAEALGMKPWDIWPSRYDENNNPIKKHRGWPTSKSFKPKHSTEASDKRQGEPS
ncbi:Nlp family transcriptional regulator [Idiomarina loihiensis]|uniref:helix-turn-helix domain-containing protein n=1 Tax=Idiomarina TaxID=135575 RepID=UPI000D843BD4|nr:MULTISPECIES: helix-turn-helix transcriptional regulator [Idiomarina]PWW41593.1 Nlp family transcriptional regulator [Idiomarina loihiensis]TDP50651.1 Nlp family transcriptional regulator [Idiomarina loihiensis]TDS25071.1 Nlp family transcriptional regulator [Idiomarina sp. H2]